MPAASPKIPAPHLMWAPVLEKIMLKHSAIAQSRFEEKSLHTRTCSFSVLKGVLAAVAWLVACGYASAHPHILITLRGEILYDGSGKVAAIRQSWAYDPAYSAFITRDLHLDGEPETAQKELATLARDQITSFAEYDYFSAVKANGAKVKFGEPRDYGFTRKNGALTLSMTLPLADP